MTDVPPATLHRRRPTLAESDLVLPANTGEGFARAVGHFAPDAIVIEHPALFPLALANRVPGVKLVVDMHNVESASTERSALTLARFAFGARRAARAAAHASAMHERLALSEADTVWVCSPDEAARLPEIAGRAAVHVVPNGIPRPESAPDAPKTPRPRRQGPTTLILAGHLGYPPNVAAAQWLVRRILPAARRRADLRVILAGRSPAPAVRALEEHPDVAVVADPPSMDDLLAAADIAVLPLRDGGGTRIKVVEALSRGVPVVATPFAVEGLGLAKGRHYEAAETTRGFARAIVALSADPETRARLAATAFRHCRENFGPGAIARAVRRALGAA